MLSGAELYDPVSGSWTTIASLNQARWFSAGTVLNDGSVLLAGGSDASDGSQVLRSAERWAPPSSLLIDAGTDQVVTSNVIAQATLTLNATTLAGTATSFTWSDGLGFTASTPSITVTRSVGAYTYTVQATDGYGQSFSDSVNVTVQLPTGLPGATGGTGATGAAGAPGATGPMGPAGPVGAIGPVGPQGSTGAPGATGATGTQGDVGATGATGAAGPTGAAGEAGATGATGPQGETGATGATGVTGATGATGAAGSQGDTGPAGTPGATGSAGAAGATGAAGEAGAAGAQGLQGPAGPAGSAAVAPTGSYLHLASGTTGPAGYSFVGTFVEERIREDGKPFRLRIDLWIKM